MTMKVHELAKEMGITSKEVIERAEKLSIIAKSHMSVLSDKDIETIKNNRLSSKTSDESKKKQIPMGIPIVDEEFLASKKKNVPMGKPIVNEEFLANREKAKQTSEKSEKEEALNKNNEKAEVKEADNKTAESTEAKKEANDKDLEKTQVKEKTSEEKTKAKKADEKIAEKSNKTEEVHKVEKAEMHREEKTLTKTTKEEFKPKNDRESNGSKGQRHERSGKADRNDRGDRNDRNGRSDRGQGGNRQSDRNDRGGRNNDRGDRNQGGNRQFAKGDRQKNDRFDKGSGDKRNSGFRGDRNQNKFDKDADSKARDFRGSKKPARQDNSGLEKMETKTGYGNREANKKFSKDKDRNKFDKFEKKSLEKQAKKKHVKNKPQVEEPEIFENLPEGTIVLTVPITVAGFCEQTEVSTSRVIMTLMKMGVMANINQNLDEDTCMLLAEDLGISVVIGKVEEEIVEEGLELFEDDEKDLKSRPPIITVMGHVDHGKTSLLDAIRKTNVTASESGGITQHIGASEVKINGQKIVFLDTPGHEAFTAMRARGAHVTDIAVLVVAADDSVKPQTVESISHAKAAGVPIIVAINKMDKPGANPDRVKQDLTEHGILVEDWGGDVISVPVSAKSGEGIVNLLEMILLQAEVMELKANPNRLAMGSVIEARLDKSKGPVATLLVTNGTLQSGQSIVAGTCAGRIRLMTDHKGKVIKKAGPATAVEILGLTEVPQAGDEFNAVKEDKVARDIAEKRKEKLREEVLARNASTTLEQLFSQIKEGEVKELNLIIKGDVQGSVGALVSSLEKLNNENVKVNIIHTGVGTVTESDVMLAGTSNAVIIGFNVRPTTAVQTMADRDSVQIRTYRVIYDVIDDVENAMKGMLDPEFKEEILGKVEIRTTFKVPGVGIIGGAYVTEGKVVRNAQVRLVRDGIVIHEGTISSLKRFKDDAKEVNQGYECGIGIQDYNDIKDGDIVECFHMVEIKAK